jgi:solute:Na+ symporter, SSS family
MSLQPIDWFIIALYGASLFVIAAFLVKAPKTSEGYFLAGRSLRWPFIGASLFAANISAEHFVGLAGSGFATGMAVGGFEWIAVYCIALLCLLFLPFYIKNKIYTVPEFLEKRFSVSVRLLFSVFMMILSVLTKISVSLWASSIVFSVLLGWDQMRVIWVVGLLTALYTMKGGLRTVVYTDALQTGILLIAAVILAVISLQHVGGWSGLHAKLGPEMFHMVKPATDPDYPWPGMFFGVFCLGCFYWAMDQVLVQRVFAARDLNEGRLGAIFAAFLKLLPPFLLVLPGLAARALFPNLKSADDAYPTLLRTLMPAGLLGLTVAGIAAALMGHVSATYNSISTLFTRDFYLRYRPDATQAQQIRVGRIVVLLIFALGALWAPVIGNFKSLFVYLQTVQAYLMMPFAGIFFFGVLWRRTTSAGVIACIASTVCLVPLFIYNAQLITEGRTALLPFMAQPLLRPWLHSAMLVAFLCMLVLCGVSLLTRATSGEKLAMTTVNWGGSGVMGPDLDAPRPFLRDYRLWLGLVVASASLLWWWMR